MSCVRQIDISQQTITNKIKSVIVPYGIDMLKWPKENALEDNNSFDWFHSGSNLCLDFHGDPVTAKLVVFSDGNHHMALEDTLKAYLNMHPELADIFYATTPPGVLSKLVSLGKMQLGNLTLSRQPHVFISPKNVIQNLVKQKSASASQSFMQSRGNVFLVKKGNPKKIQSVADLLRKDISLFISNPKTESASYEIYAETLLNLATQENLDIDKIKQRIQLASGNTCFGECIHHREAPQAIVTDAADAAIVYYHLALRYTRIFPDDFEIIPLPGSPDTEHFSGNLQSQYHFCLMKEPSTIAGDFLNFLQSSKVTEIYEHHGLMRSRS